MDMATDESEFRLRGDSGFGSQSTPTASNTVHRSFRSPEEIDDFLRPPSDRQNVADERQQLLDKMLAARDALEAEFRACKQQILEERERRKVLEEMIAKAAILPGEAGSEVTWGPGRNSEAVGTVAGHNLVAATHDNTDVRSVDNYVPPRRVAATIKLGSFNGSTPLEIFLAKLDNCKEYYEWSERDTVHHLRASLEGSAGQILLESSGQDSLEGIIGLLKTRFGNQNQAERFRAELRTRRRADGESLQSVYADIRRLMALSFPGQQGPVYDIVARDAFLAAISPPIRRRVLERDPPPDTLEAALSAAVRLEALDLSEAALYPASRNDSRTFSVRATTVDDRIRQIEEKFDSAIAAMQQQVNELMLALANCMSMKPVARNRAPRTLSLQPGSVGTSDQGKDWKAPGGTNRGGGGGRCVQKGQGVKVSQCAKVSGHKQPLSTNRQEAGDSVPEVHSTLPAVAEVRAVRVCQSAEGHGGIEEGLSTEQAAEGRVDGVDGFPVSTNAAGRRKHHKRGQRRVPLLASADVLEGQWTAEYLSSSQQADDELKKLLQWKIGTVVRPNWSDMQGYSASLKSYWRQYDSIILQGGVLYRKFIQGSGQPDVLQFLAPRTMQKSILELTHAGATGHLTVKKTEVQLQRHAYWYEWKSAVTSFCRQCSRCARQQLTTINGRTSSGSRRQQGRAS